MSGSDRTPHVCHVSSSRQTRCFPNTTASGHETQVSNASDVSKSQTVLNRGVFKLGAPSLGMSFGGANIDSFLVFPGNVGQEKHGNISETEKL